MKEEKTYIRREHINIATDIPSDKEEDDDYVKIFQDIENILRKAEENDIILNYHIDHMFAEKVDYLYEE